MISLSKYNMINLFKKEALIVKYLNSYMETIYSFENKLIVQNKLKSFPPFLPKNLFKNAKNAAVLIPLCVYNNKPSILFCQRSMKVRSHRGQVCFPGGMQEENGESLIQTALRETQEEIGVSLKDSDVWGSFGGCASQNGQSYVTPVVANIGKLNWDKIIENSNEVNFTFARSLEFLCEPKNIGYTISRFSSNNADKVYKIPVFGGFNNDFPRIWGLTALFTHQFLHLLLPEYFKGIELNLG